MQASEVTTPIQAAQVKKGGYVMLNGRPCRVSNVKHAKAGKHGGIKARISGKCIFTAAKQDCFFAGHLILQEPEVTKTTHQLSCLDEKEGLKFFDGDELESLPLIDSDPTVAAFLKGNEQGVTLKEALDKDKEAEFDFSITLLAAPVVLDGKTKYVKTLSEWKANKAE
eukprot:gb/GEZN01016129.1/.p1 GENE.gb/GEZN01016129.1/~~gb/GEZN01016129.1/.p1  ORF type:complete len:168 (-),score=45.09 gb/GEZN01016129.1/:271-774(-)